ncbi:FlxA-like family protein [Paenibacillus xylanilyticus]|uniref:FlxA-like family protein n=1 Tax=Paenibacillus xylanilyticus TaxID=248903 RepID=UPI00129E9243|nr:FlxA-like family protein [Paenibacillus xylanilyticus]
MSTISPIFTKSTVTPVSPLPTSKRDKEIQNLLEQKGRLNEQLNDIRSNDEMNDEIKKERIKSLQESIQQLDAHISQIKTEEIEEKNKKSQMDSSKQDKSSNNTKDDSLDPLLQKAQSYNQLGQLIGLVSQKTNTNRSVEGEIRSDRMTHTLPHEIKSAHDKDSGKSVMLENAEMTVLQKKREFVQKEIAKISKIEDKISEIIEEVHEKNSLPDEGIVSDSKLDEQSNTKVDNTDQSSIQESQQSPDTKQKSIDIRI